MDGPVPALPLLHTPAPAAGSNPRGWERAGCWESDGAVGAGARTQPRLDSWDAPTLPMRLGPTGDSVSGNWAGLVLLAQG